MSSYERKSTFNTFFFIIRPLQFPRYFFRRHQAYFTTASGQFYIRNVFPDLYFSSKYTLSTSQNWKMFVRFLKTPWTKKKLLKNEYLKNVTTFFVTPPDHKEYNRKTFGTRKCKSPFRANPEWKMKKKKGPLPYPRFWKLGNLSREKVVQL